MSAKANPVIGAVIHKDGKLEPFEGDDPSSQWTYRVDAKASTPSDDEKRMKT